MVLSSMWRAKNCPTPTRMILPRRPDRACRGHAANEPLGRVVAIHNFGAGDIIEIAPPAASTMLLPFTNAVVPSVDIAGGRVVIELPDEIEGDDPPSGHLSHDCRDKILARDRPHAVSGDVPGAARRQPRRQGAGVGPVGAGGARHQGLRPPTATAASTTPRPAAAPAWCCAPTCWRPRSMPRMSRRSGRGS